MMTHTRTGFTSFAAVLGVAALLAGCAAPRGNAPAPTTQAQPQWQSPGPRGGACNAAPAQGFVGQAGTASVTEKARVASGAAMARVLRPNQPVTGEYNPERLNLMHDDKGQIKAVTCS